jgi:glycosyltransferase involved in cell wall biosynthesis
LSQTLRPSEILVMDDGSTDETVSFLKSEYSGLTVFQQANSGVAIARGRLCEKATGDLVAFLDHDDVWHPRYLETQAEIFKKYPTAVASFAGHCNFYGYEDYKGSEHTLSAGAESTLLPPLEFFNALQTRSGDFGSASFLCIPRKILAKLEGEPFRVRVGDGDDRYLSMALALLGPVAYCSEPLVAYRVIREAQSTNEAKSAAMGVDFFRFLQERFNNLADPMLLQAFRAAFASKRRYYAKRLLGASRTVEARTELWRSFQNSRSLESVAKSLALLFLTFVPRMMQPIWPPITRAWKEPGSCR